MNTVATGGARRGPSAGPAATGPALRFLRAVASLGCFLSCTGALHAGTLAGDLHRFIDSNGFPTFGQFIEAITPIVERQAVRGVDFPVTATTPGFTYRFNFELGAPERSSDSLGPVFAERADTIGARRADVGVSYLHAELTQFEGADFADQIATSGTISLPTTAGPLQLTQSFAADHFSLASDIVSLSGTYGVTNRLDVNALVPLVWTSLELSGRASARVAGEAPVSDTPHFSESSVGVGDVLLRAKYRFLDAPLHVASTLTLRFPTGSAGDFQGIGDTTVLAGLVASRTFGRQDVHGALGFETNADDLERSRARYALGVALQPSDRFAFLLDVIGSSSVVDDEFFIPAPAGILLRSGGFRQVFGNDELVDAVRRDGIVAFVPRSDVVDLFVGFKANLVGTTVAFASVILPITDDGLRAEVIPAVGLEYGF